MNKRLFVSSSLAFLASFVFGIGQSAVLNKRRIHEAAMSEPASDILAAVSSLPSG